MTDYTLYDAQSILIKAHQKKATYDELVNALKDMIDGFVCKEKEYDYLLMDKEELKEKVSDLKKSVNLYFEVNALEQSDNELIQKIKNNMDEIE